MISMKVKYFLQLYRIDVFVVTTLTSLIGYYFSFGELSVGMILKSFFISSFLYNYVYVINAITDLKEDRINKPERPLPSGKLSLKSAYIYLMFITAVSSVGISLLFGGHNLFAAFLIILFGMLYSVPPFALKRIPIVAPFITGWGLIHPMFVAGNRSIIMMSLTLICFATGVTMLKDLSDIEGDKAAGRKVITDYISVKPIREVSVVTTKTSIL